MLRPYPKQIQTKPTGKRHYPTTREYVVNLFGWRLPIDTLAFTSQDKTVGACASFALWMAFDKTHKLFNTQLYTPSEITRRAGKARNIRYRAFPSRGLDTFQIGTVIETTGLEPEYRAIDVLPDELNFRLWADPETHQLLSKLPDGPRLPSVVDVDLVKAYIYAYCQLGVPVLLGFHYKEGDHLVTVTGYRELDEEDHQLESFKEMLGERLLLKSRRIDRLYCHDDNVGAFSRLFFCEDKNDIILMPDSVSVPKTYYGTIISSLPSTETAPNRYNAFDKEHTDQMRKRAELKYICVPIDGSIRLTFEDVYSKVSHIDNLFDVIAKNFVKPDSQLTDEVDSPEVDTLRNLRHLEWDIYLSDVKSYKNSILKSKEAIHKKTLGTTLSQLLPRYVWVARGRLFSDVEGERTWKTYAELVFDSSESPVAYPCKLFTFDADVELLLANFFIVLTKGEGKEKKEKLAKFNELFETISRENLSELMSQVMMKERFFDPISEAIRRLRLQDSP